MLSPTSLCATVCNNYGVSQTTAHTLAFTLGLLALYPDEEEKLYQEIKSVLADGRLPVRICSVAWKLL